MVRVVLGVAVLAAVWAGGDTPFMINEDNSHFYFTRSEEDLTKAGLNAWVDQYAGTAVTHLFLCPNAMRASFKSATRDAIWETGDQTAPPPGSGGDRWSVNARMLHERDLDPYAQWIARARERGISPWVSMRMNDIHEVPDATNYMHSTFWVDHPQYRRVTENPRSWEDRALDFSHAEVRAHAMDFVKELLARYDVDGIELDWMRFPYHFAPGTEEAGKAILTEFMRETRRYADAAAEERGHAIQVSARVPTHPDNAAGLGMDAVAWAKEGLVDMLVVTPFWTTCDSDVPVELWRERLGEADERVVVAGGIEYRVCAYPGGPAEAAGVEGARGFAAMLLERGAEAVYLFNYMDNGPQAEANEAYHAMLEEGMNLAAVTAHPRRHVVTYRDTVAPGASRNAQLPVTLDETQSITVHLGPAPKTGTATLRVGLVPPEDAAIDAGSVKVAVNGTNCPKASDAAGNGVPGASRTLDVDVPLDALRSGANTFEIGVESGPAKLVWVELWLDPTA